MTLRRRDGIRGPSFLQEYAATAGADPSRVELRYATPLDDAFLCHLGRMLADHLQSAPCPLLAGRLTDALARHLLERHSVRPLAAAPPPPPATDRRVREAIDYIEAHFTSPGLKVAKLAELFDIDRRQLSRLFAATPFGSPHEYIIRRRVRRARELLAAGRRPDVVGVADEGGFVAWVAQEAGFSDQSHMNRLFRAVPGLTPVRFLEMCR